MSIKKKKKKNRTLVFSLAGFLLGIWRTIGGIQLYAGLTYIGTDGPKSTRGFGGDVAINLRVLDSVADKYVRSVEWIVKKEVVF
jgi:hypothetical protein